MKLETREIEQFCAVYTRVSGRELPPEIAASTATEFLELMKILTNDYEHYIDVP